MKFAKINTDWGAITKVKNWGAIKNKNKGVTSKKKKKI